MTSTPYGAGPTGLLLIDTTNEAFHEDGKGYPFYQGEVLPRLSHTRTDQT
ncbi:hypothetical protein [Streptomyces sp. SAI-129]